MLTAAWIAAHRVRRRAARALRPPPDRERLVRERVRGRSFLDVGAMWNVHGAVAFAAEEGGATRVTALDVMAPTPAYLEQHAHRGSAVRFVEGDVHDPDTLRRAGSHQVVWCSGVLYHAPHPLLTLQRLRSLTEETLVLATETLPELPWTRGAAVFYPALDDRSRRAYRAVPGGRALGVTEAFDPGEGYGNWYWGLSPSALHGLLEVAGFHVQRSWGDPFHRTVLAHPA